MCITCNKKKKKKSSKSLRDCISIDFIKDVLLTTIMDKSRWESQNVTSILCVSQVVAKSSAVFLQIHAPPPLHPNQCWKIKGIVPWRFQHCLWGGGRGYWRTVLEARGFNFACVKLKAFELYIYPKTFFHDCRCLPCKQWFLQAGRYATKGEKPLRASVCFFYRAAVQRYGRIN